MRHLDPIPGPYSSPSGLVAAAAAAASAASAAAAAAAAAAAGHVTRGVHDIRWGVGGWGVGGYSHSDINHALTTIQDRSSEKNVLTVFNQSFCMIVRHNTVYLSFSCYYIYDT